MRVHERGVGETRSCGTGVCAAAVAYALQSGGVAEVRDVSVEVPGGSLAVRISESGEVRLAGPAVVVARGEIDRGWLAVHV